METKAAKAPNQHAARQDMVNQPVPVKRTARELDGDGDEEDDKWRGGHHGYMVVKKRKLLQQFRNEAKEANSSSLFRGISIHVNGNTSPTAEELKRLMMLHGGTYHLYYNTKKTTHIIASNLPYTKIVQLYGKAVVKPAWITESIRQGCLLPWRDFELYPVASNNAPQPATEKAGSEVIALKAGDPNYVNQFYARSRLHHLSMWKVESKQLVQSLQDTSDGSFPGRERLRQYYAQLPSRPKEALKKVIMHIDFDCFFVSVGLLSRPHLRGKPIAVCHGTTGFKTKEGAKEGQERFDSKSEISSCNYEARNAGLKNGMYLGSAKQMCPDLVQIPYEFEEYKRISTVFYEIVASYTIDIEAISCDEMLVDCTDVLAASSTSPVEFVGFLRKEIFDRTGCTASAGLGKNQLLARLATRKAKPNGHMYVSDPEVKSFMNNVLVKDLPGVGYSAVEKFDKLGVKDCGELQKVSLEKLQSVFGPKNGLKFFNYARGTDDRVVANDTVRKSVSADVNYGMRMTSVAQFEAFFRELSEEVQRRLDTARVKAHLITLKLLVRHPDAPFEPDKFMGCGQCNAVNKSVSLIQPTNSAEIIATEGIALFKKTGVDVKEVRGIGVQCQRLVQTNAKGTEAKEAPKDRSLDKAKKNVGKKVDLPDEEPLNVSDETADFDESQTSLGGSAMPVARLRPPMSDASLRKTSEWSRKAVRYDIQAEVGWTRVYNQVWENLQQWALKVKAQQNSGEPPRFLEHTHIQEALPADKDKLNLVGQLVAKDVSASLPPRNPNAATKEPILKMKIESPKKLPLKPNPKARAKTQDELDPVADNEFQRMTKDTEHKFWLNYFAVPEVPSITRMPSSLHGCTLVYLDNPIVRRVNEMGGKFVAAKVTWAVWHLNTAYEDEWLDELEGAYAYDEEQSADPGVANKRGNKRMASPTKKVHKQMLLDLNPAPAVPLPPPPKTPEPERKKTSMFEITSPSQIDEEVLMALPADLRAEMYETFIAQKKLKAQDDGEPGQSWKAISVFPIKNKVEAPKPARNEPKKLSQSSKQPLVTDMFRSRKYPAASQEAPKKAAKVVDLVELNLVPEKAAEVLAELPLETIPSSQQARIPELFGSRSADTMVKRIQESVKSSRGPDEALALQLEDFCVVCCRDKKISQLETVVKRLYREVDGLRGRRRDVWAKMYEKVTTHFRLIAQKYLKSALKIPTLP
ncbi:hypothetical protein RvY_13749 [Ramazzottius varieornatus]|uniref:DNA repair protein REV1 n=1 Tax=Ramazzottius varieornatus TaxID=947166 RepID=A0A1D1VNZ9_RAMVA|nr:hypothetical protein RvY_13749 [Ramazzottius varieornatus]